MRLYCHSHILIKVKKYALKVKTLAFLLVLLPCFLTLVHSANAQFSQTLTAIPPRLELKAEPGEFIQEKIQFRNESESTLYFSPIVKDLTQKVPPVLLTVRSQAVGQPPLGLRLLPPLLLLPLAKLLILT